MKKADESLSHSLGTKHVIIAGVSLVVAASTLVSDFIGYFTLGWGFVIALILAAFVNLLLAMSAADLSASIPKAGALYEYSKSIFSGNTGVYIGIFLGLSFYIMYGFAVSGEVSAGSYAAQSLFNVNWDIRIFVVILSLCVVIPNVIGVKETAIFSAVLLIFMLGIRWFFGLSGFFGWGDFGAWSANNLTINGALPPLFGDNGILVAGFALAIWSFVGIEFACSLAEETETPKKNMPRGLLIGIAIILFTSMLMGIGVVGTAPLSDWQKLAESTTSCEGSCAQLAIGEIGFGKIGHALMAIASITATLGTVTIGLAAMSRVLYAIGKDGYLFGSKISSFFGNLNPKTHTPVNAILFTGALYILPAFYSSEVVNLLYTAAYVWIIMYIAFHILAIFNRKIHPYREFGMGRNFSIAPYIGVISTVLSLYYSFYGSHIEFGLKAIYMLTAAALISAVSVSISREKISAPFESKQNKAITNG